MNLYTFYISCFSAAMQSFCSLLYLCLDCYFIHDIIRIQVHVILEFLSKAKKPYILNFESLVINVVKVKLLELWNCH